MDNRRVPSLGFTLLELMITLVLVAILLTIAVPSYRSLRQEQMVKAATQAIYTDLMLLKSESVKRNTPISFIVFNSGQSNWCYRIDIDGSGSCNSCADSCSVLDGRKGGDATEYGGLSLQASYSESATGIRPILFSPRRGTLPSGHVQVTIADYSTKVMTSNIGRVRVCAVSDKVSGIPLCN